MELAPIFKKAYWTLAASGLAYVLLVFALTFPDLQRAYVCLFIVLFAVSELTVPAGSAVYMNHINPSRFYDVNDVENFGFLSTAPRPFSVVLSIY